MGLTIKNQTLRVRFKFLLGICISLVLAVVAAGSVSAIARGYKTNDAGLQLGMVVALSSNNDDDLTIERATQETSKRVVGVATSVDASFVTIASSTASVLVENEGEVSVYVSDLGGQASRGDFLILSPVKGVLMKAATSDTAPIIGIVTSNVASSDTDTKYEVDYNGKKQFTNISRVKINLSRSGLVNNSGQTTSVLSNLGESITGKKVNEARVLLALILFVIVLIAEGGILYGSISSAIAALGRNPLASKVIRRELKRVIVVAITVLIIGLGSVYMILWV